MEELRQSLNGMGVLQHLSAVAFLICYVFAIGGFLGREVWRTVALATLLSGAAFIGSFDNLVHGILLTAFAVLGVGSYLAVGWGLKFVCEAALAPALLPPDMTRNRMHATQDDLPSPVIPGDVYGVTRHLA